MCWWGAAPVHVLHDCDLLVLSPGIPLKHSFVQAALAEQIPVISELAYAMEILPPDLRTIMITGTNGKSTTTAFVRDMLQDLGLNVWAGGNFGSPVSCLAAAIALGEVPPDVAVIEVSSYQLEAPGLIEPYAAAVLNLSPDHLSRHGNMQQYARTKLRLVSSMPPGAPRLVSPDVMAHARCIPISMAYTGSGHMEGLEHHQHSTEVTIQHPGWSRSRQLDLSGLQPVGRHNRENAAVAAFLASAVVGESRWDDIQAAIPRLTALPHRIQPVHSSCGVTWISDSKATNVNAAKVRNLVVFIAAPYRNNDCQNGLFSVVEEHLPHVVHAWPRIQVAVDTLQGRAVILFGGQGKQDGSGMLGFSAIASMCTQHVVITFGNSAESISAELIVNGIRPFAACRRLRDAVRHAKNILKQDSSIKNVLLSPGCASFDEFKGFEDRGSHFAELAACDAL